MTSEAIGGIVRTILSAVGGYYVGKGLIDSDTAVQLAGAAATLAAGIWSILNKKKLVG